MTGSAAAPSFRPQDNGSAGMKDPESICPALWASQANDRTLPLGTRCRAVYQLFYRFVRPGLTLGELARLLGRPGWLRSEQVELIEVYMGKLPVSFTGRDAVYYLDFFPECIRAESGVYMRLAGYVVPRHVAPLLLGEITDIDVSGTRLLEVAWVSRNGDHWILRPEGLTTDE